MQYEPITVILILIVAAVFFEAMRIGLNARIAIRLGAETRPFSRLLPSPRTRLLIIGDSTVYGTGATDPQMSLAGRIGMDYPDTEIINASQTAMSLRQLAGKLRVIDVQNFDLVLILIGGIDVLALTPEAIAKNRLRAALKLAKNSKSGNVLFITMNNVGAVPFFRFPLNRILDYRSKNFTSAFAQVSKECGVDHLPLYKSVSEDPFSGDRKKYFAKDGIHPNDEGYALWYSRIKPLIQSHLARP